MTTALAAPLTERAELASPHWIAVAGAFLAGFNPRVQTLAAPWRYCARFENPPPHLSPQGESLAYTITFSSTGIEISSMADSGAERFEVADYNCALPLSWIVYGDNPEARRLEREYRLLFAFGRREPQERTPAPEAVRKILAALHDHMARRTINNPDIRQRAKRLGLENNLDDLDKHGYTVLESAFSADYADDLRAETDRNHAGREDGASFRATMLLQRGRIWEEAAMHPWVLTVVEWILGRGCLLYQSDTIVKGPGQETHPGLHSDYSASRITEPFPDYCLEGTAVWAIDDFHRQHGPTCILPSSVNKRSHVPPGTTQEGTRLIEMDQGSIAFWHGGLWHGSTPRTAPGQRHSLHNAYCRHFIRPLEGYQSIDPVIVRRNPPVFSTLCGLDDAFGKSGLTGADFERLGYAARQGYGRSAWPGVR
jgi:hypothetical protein